MTAIQAWTNYPLNKSKLPGTLYYVEVLAFDGNKYVAVMHDNLVYSMKYGYLYANQGCTKPLASEVLDRVPIDRARLIAPDIISA